MRAAGLLDELSLARSSRDRPARRAISGRLSPRRRGRGARVDRRLPAVRGGGRARRRRPTAARTHGDLDDVLRGRLSRRPRRPARSPGWLPRRDATSTSSCCARPATCRRHRGARGRRAVAAAHPAGAPPGLRLLPRPAARRGVPPGEPTGQVAPPPAPGAVAGDHLRRPHRRGGRPAGRPVRPRRERRAGDEATTAAADVGPPGSRTRRRSGCTAPPSRAARPCRGAGPRPRWRSGRSPRWRPRSTRCAATPTPELEQAPGAHGRPGRVRPPSSALTPSWPCGPPASCRGRHLRGAPAGPPRGRARRHGSGRCRRGPLRGRRIVVSPGDARRAAVGTSRYRHAGPRGAVAEHRHPPRRARPAWAAHGSGCWASDGEAQAAAGGDQPRPGGGRPVQPGGGAGLRRRHLAAPSATVGGSRVTSPSSRALRPSRLRLLPRWGRVLDGWSGTGRAGHRPGPARHRQPRVGGGVRADAVLAVAARRSVGSDSQPSAARAVLDAAVAAAQAQRRRVVAPRGDAAARRHATGRPPSSRLRSAAADRPPAHGSARAAPALSSVTLNRRGFAGPLPGVLPTA